MSTSVGKIPQPVSPREWAQLPPSEYISAFTLQQKQSIGVNFASTTERFKSNKPGSYYAIGTAEPSSFRPNNPHHKPRQPSKEEIPQHRPLWLSELRKEVPAAANYDLDQAIGSKKTLHKTRAATFKSNYDKYNRTCDIQKDIKVFNQNAESNNRGVGSYDVDRGVYATKKTVPGYSQSKAKQFVLWEKEMKRGQETPAPSQYKQEDHATKRSRFNNIHMGTDIKTTLKDIGLTPGPGHYQRTDEQYPRTFHHATKRGTNINPVFSFPKTSKNKTSNVNLAEHSQSFTNETGRDFAEAKRSSLMHKTTASNFFGAPTGADIFADSLASAFTKKVQPPMVMGKAKVPSDLQCVLNSRQKHQTVEHTRTQTSFVNASFHDYGRGDDLSPLDIAAIARNGSGRQSYNAKPFKKQIQTDRKVFLPKQRSLVVKNTSSEEKFEGKHRNGNNRTTAKGPSKNFINMRSGDGLSLDDYAVGSTNVIINKNNLKLGTFTNGTMSDVSTTVMAQSQNHRGAQHHKAGSMGAGFAELGAGLIIDTPHSKRSVELHSRFRSANQKTGSGLQKHNKNQSSRTNVAYVHKRRQSLAQSGSKRHIKRGNSSNLLNKIGCLSHSNFI